MLMQGGTRERVKQYTDTLNNEIISCAGKKVKYETGTRSASLPHYRGTKSGSFCMQKQVRQLHL